jgi:hypothetical protein
MPEGSGGLTVDWRVLGLAIERGRAVERAAQLPPGTCAAASTATTQTWGAEVRPELVLTVSNAGATVGLPLQFEFVAGQTAAWPTLLPSARGTPDGAMAAGILRWLSDGDGGIKCMGAGAGPPGHPDQGRFALLTRSCTFEPVAARR